MHRHSSTRAAARKVRDNLQTIRTGKASNALTGTRAGTSCRRLFPFLAALLSSLTLVAQARMQPAGPKIPHTTRRRGWRWLTLTVLLLAIGVVEPAWASCPSTVTLSVPAGGSIALDCPTDGSGTNFGFYGVDSDHSVTTTYGHVSLYDPAHDVYAAGYFNTSGAGQTDTFDLKDGSNAQIVHFIINIGPGSITLDPASLPNPTVGTAYSQTLTASGGTAPYTFSVTAGALPAGLSLASNGTLSGTPSASGPFNFTVQAQDANNQVATQTYNLAVSGATLTLAPLTLPHGTVGVTYGQNLSTTGGIAPYSYAITAGALPAGLTLAADGSFSGTPTASGTFNFDVRVSDSSGGTPSTATVSYALVIDAPTITVSPATLPAGQLNSAYSATISASGGTAPYSYAVTAGVLPAGLALSAAGALSGTPTASGTFNFNVTATDQTSGTGPFSQTRSYTLQIDVPPPIANSVSATVAYGSGANPITLNITGGAPTSVAIGTAAGHGSALASGTSITYQPNAGFASSDSFTYTASNAGGTSAPATVSITVSPPALSLTPAAGTTLALDYNVAYSKTFSTSGGAGPYSYVLTGMLPAGLSFSAVSGTLSGTPTQSGSFPVTVTTTDSSTGIGAPFSVSNNYTLQVNPPTITIIPATLPAGTAGSAYIQSLAASGGIGPYTFSVTAGALPTGLSLASNGTLSGTPSASGPFNFTVQAQDANSQVGTRAYNLTVSGATLTLAPSTLPDGAVGTAYSQSFSTTGGIAPYSYAITAGTLPAGLTLAANGILSGTPTASGTSHFDVQVSDSSGGTASTATVSYALVIDASTITLSPATLPTGQLNSAYSATISASGGTAPYNYAVTAGELPTGLHLAGNGTLSGTPSAFGTFHFTVSATDSSTGSGPYSASRAYTLTIADIPVIANPVSATVAYGSSANPITLNITGGTPTSVAIGTAASHGTALANGTSITYQPNASFAGGDSFTYTASNAGGTSAPATVSITVSPPTLSLTPTADTLTLDYNVAYSKTFSASGGTGPYSYVLTGTLPGGLSFSAANGTLSGTPTQSGSFPITVTATDSSTGSSAPFSVNRNYTLEVNGVTLSVTPASLPAMQAGKAFSQQLTAAGGNGSYSFSVTQGTLPAGLTLTSAGLLSGTPTSAGHYAFTVTATDGNGFTGTVAYTDSVEQAVPVSVDDTATTKANQTVTLKVTDNDTGPFSNVAVVDAPAHGTTKIQGLDVIYTPDHDFFGEDTFTYTATGPGGTSAPATATIHVAALAVPVVKPHKATVLAGKSVTIDAAEDATGGPFTTLALASKPASGTVTIKGTQLVYAAAADASGQVAFEYTLSNAFGASHPARVTITVNPRPLAPSLTARVLAGKTAHVSLTDRAHGGPFTEATLVSVKPANAGEASVHADGTGYMLDFRAADDFSGEARVTYTLANAYATSAPGTVRVSVAARPDPSTDAEVLGILAAQAQAARRLARGQIDNFEQRLESLHDGNTRAAFSNGLRFSMASARYLRQRDQWNPRQDRNRQTYRLRQAPPAATAAASRHDGQRSTPGGISIWTGGAVQFGSGTPGGSTSGIDFTTSGITIGADKRIGRNFSLGLGVGYGRDVTDVGHLGSRITADSYNLAIYGSYHPDNGVYVDGLLGYQWLSLESRRHVTANGNTVYGKRDGKQWFGSLAVGYEHHGQHVSLAPYVRLDAARARLDVYTEHGDDSYALRFGQQDVDTLSSSFGLRAQWNLKRDYGMWMPNVRVAYRHDFQGSSSVALHYADMLDGLTYHAGVPDFAHDHMLLGAGVGLQTRSDWSMRFEYRNLLDNSTHANQSILLEVDKTFPP